MNRHVTAGVLLAGLGLVWGGGARADETAGWYFGLSGGLTGADISKNDFDSDFADIFSAAALQVTGSLPDAIFVDSELDDSDKGWGLHIGYRFTRYVAAEVGYLDLGEFLYANQVQMDVLSAPLIFNSDVRFQVSGPFASVLGMFPINERFDVHVRGGILFSDTRMRVRFVAVEPDLPETFFSGEVRDSEKDFFAGIGATWNINPSYSLRVEYQRFLDVGGDNVGETDVDLISASLLFR